MARSSGTCVFVFFEGNPILSYKMAMLISIPTNSLQDVPSSGTSAGFAVVCAFVFLVIGILSGV